MKSLTDYIVESQKVKLDSDGKEHGFEYVDLGLPSGTMWATCNVGADKPEDDGLLFQFGRTDGYKYGDINNKFSTADENENATGNEYINSTTSGTTYKKNDILKLEDDAAHVNMGGKWIMPTKSDLKELYDNTLRKKVTINRKKGMLFTSKINGKSLFVPFVGVWYFDDTKFYNKNKCSYLWSSEVHSNDSRYAWALFFNYGDDCSIYSGGDGRAYGYSVRGVFKK